MKKYRQKKYPETLRKRKTYDVSDHWEEGREDYVLVDFRFTQTDRPNGRPEVLSSLAIFDRHVSSGWRFLRKELDISLVAEDWDGPWWTTFSNSGEVHQQQNYERQEFSRLEWESIQEVLDKNGWERW